MASIVVGRLGLCGRVRGAVLPMPLEWSGFTAPAGAPTPSLPPRSCLMLRGRGFSGHDLATYPTNAAGGVVHQACGAKGGAPAGRDPCPHLEPTRLKAYSRLPRTGAWPGRRPG